jgi:hypothetical protein
MQALQAKYPEQARIVKMMVQGRMPPPAGYQLSRSPYWVKMLNLGAQYDPKFDEATWGARYKTRTSMAPGGAGFKDKQAINQLLEHSNELYNTGHALKNYDSGHYYSYLANLANVAYKHATQDPNLTSFGQAKNAVIHELSKNWKGSGQATDSDISKWEHDIQDTTSPQQLDSYIREIANLLEGRIKPYQEVISGAPGMSDIQMLTPSGQAAMDKLRSETGSETDPQATEKPNGQGAQPQFNIPSPPGPPPPAQGDQPGAAPQGAQQAPPQVGAVHDGFRFKGGNPNDQSSWEPVEQLGL